MASPVVQILVILVLLVINGVFAMSEIAVVSARKVRLQQQAEEGNANAKVALGLAGEPTLFLSTVQIGITLVGILAGAFGGATLAGELAGYLQGLPLIGPYSQAISVGVVVISITYLSLLIGELVPKRLALNNPEKVAALVARPMRWLSVIAAPAVGILTFSTDFVLRILGVRPSDEPPITEEEIRVLLEQGTEAGIFEEAEQDMVFGVFELNDEPISALMTPRMDIIWLDVEDTLQEIGRKITNSVYSRFPVCRDGLDHVLGIVRAKDLLPYTLAGQEVNLPDIIHPPLYIPESVLASRVLELFKQAQTHIALIIDEYGSTQGLVTLNDVVEAIVGGIEPAKPQAVQRQDGSWLVDGALSIDQFKEIFDIEYLPGDNKGYYQTLAGFIMAFLERVPTVGEQLDWNGFQLEVVDMDGYRIDKVLVSVGESPPSPDAGDNP